MDRRFITEEITAAMRSQDKTRLSILRLVKNEIETTEKAEGREVADEEVIGALKKVLKQTGETLQASEKAATDDERTALLRERVEILEGYLPAQCTGEQLVAVVDAVLAEHSFAEKRDMGRAIGLVVESTGGNCDKAEVARIIGPRLA